MRTLPREEGMQRGSGCMDTNLGRLFLPPSDTLQGP